MALGCRRDARRQRHSGSLLVELVICFRDGLRGAQRGLSYVGGRQYDRRHEISRKDAILGRLYPIAALRRHEVCPVDGNYAATTLRFDASLVTKVMADIFEHQRLTTLDLTPLVDLSTGVGQSLQSLARTIASGLHGEQLLMRSPRALVLLSEATLRLIFENVPHGLIDRLDRGCQEGTPRHIRAAIDYMRVNLHLPLAMADVAAAAGVSLRSIELGFRRFLDTTPLAYLRRIRLDAVHAELSLPQNSLLVHEVAAKWGFLHMGHFAAQYRSVFGVSPSETVRRAIFNR
jgi:AraC-like DNA-binding protein